MNDELIRMLELSQQGLNCSQILMQLGLEVRGEKNPQLVRAVGALAGGVGFCGKTCGALTGAACLLSLLSAGAPDEDDERVTNLVMIDQLVEWFEQEIGEQYGGIACDDILGPAVESKVPSSQCAAIVSSTYAKVKEIAYASGVGTFDDSIDE